MNGRATKSSSIRKSIAIGVLGAAVGGLFPATAFAATPASGSTGSASGTGSPSDPRCTPADLPAAKGYVEGLLKARVVRLERLTAQVGTARYVTASDKAELESELSNELSGMQSLEQQLPGDTTCAELVTNAETMVFNYRVYYVMTPQTELVVVADTETGVASDIVRWEPGIQAAITYEAAHGKDVAKAQKALDDMKAQLTDALGTLDGVSSTVLAQTPSGYPGNHVVFVAARNRCADAFSDLGHARADLGTILSVLS
ncbi:MAG: hypothetical protein ACLP6E_07530 [Acidimicrobiales bacterium]